MPDSTSLYRHDYLPLCTIAGSDPTGGAGLQGDLRTFAAHGGHGCGVVTALTAQGPEGVRRVEVVRPELVAAQLEAAIEVVRPVALKTGMLATAAVLEAVAGVFDRAPPAALVVDPVLAAGAGGRLLEPSAVALLGERLAPHAVLITPNLPEAARLLGGRALPAGEEEGAGEALLAAGWKAVLLKGGHGDGPTSVDRLFTPDGLTAFEHARLPGPPVHGTGCALAAAVTARLGRGASLVEAVGGATEYVHQALRRARRLGTWLLPHLAAGGGA